MEANYELTNYGNAKYLRFKFIYFISFLLILSKKLLVQKNWHLSKSRFINSTVKKMLHMGCNWVSIGLSCVIK